MKIESSSKRAKKKYPKRTPVIDFRDGGLEMPIRYRPMISSDVRQCVEIVKAHPSLRPRYGGAVAHLDAALVRVLGSDGVGAVMFEDAI
jgi:hypothetical protein